MVKHGWSIRRRNALPLVDGWIFDLSLSNEQLDLSTTVNMTFVNTFLN